MVLAVLVAVVLAAAQAAADELPGGLCLLRVV